MIKTLKKLFIFSSLLYSTLIINGCREEIVPNDSDYSSYGWYRYENNEYVEALTWFRAAVEDDPNFSDAYRGVGWTMGRLGQADSAAYYFLNYLERDTTNFENKLDFYAGLAFAYNALGEDERTREYAKTYFFGSQNPDIGDPNWCFCPHSNQPINQLDVRLVLAIAEFRLGLFEDCEVSINKLYADLPQSQMKKGIDYIEDEATYNDIFDTGDQIFNGEWNDLDNDGEIDDDGTTPEQRYFDVYPLNYDNGTPVGRAMLLNHLEMFSWKLEMSNNDNGLKCNELNNNILGSGYCVE